MSTNQNPRTVESSTLNVSLLRHWSVCLFYGNSVMIWLNHLHSPQWKSTLKRWPSTARITKHKQTHL